MGELIEMLFGLRTQVDPRNHVLDGGVVIIIIQHLYSTLKSSG